MSAKPANASAVADAACALRGGAAAGIAAQAGTGDRFFVVQETAKCVAEGR